MLIQRITRAVSEQNFNVSHTYHRILLKTITVSNRYKNYIELLIHLSAQNDNIKVINVIRFLLRKTQVNAVFD